MPRAISCWIVTLAVLFAATARGAEHPVLIDGIAATVGKTPITVQEAYFFRALMRLREGTEDPFRLEQGDELRKTVQKIAFEEMVYAELKSIAFDAGPRVQAVEEIQRIKKSKGKEKVFVDVLKRFGRTEAEATDRLYRSIQVDKFLQKKVETLTPIITFKEVEQYYQQNQERFKGSSFESLRSSIEVLLKKERMRKALEEWIRFLRDKYGVTNNLTE